MKEQTMKVIEVVIKVLKAILAALTGAFGQVQNSSCLEKPNPAGRKSPRRIFCLQKKERKKREKHLHKRPVAAATCLRTRRKNNEDIKKVALNFCISQKYD